MSALDQAFIKAYSQQNPALAPASVATVTKTGMQKTPAKSAVSATSAPPAALSSSGAKAESKPASLGTAKAPAKRKAKSPGKAATDSVFEAIEQIGDKKKSSPKSASKKTTPAKKTKKSKEENEEAAGPKKPGVSDTLYRLDMPAAPAGAAAIDRSVIPSPHTEVIFSAVDAAASQREPLSNQSGSRNAERPSPKNLVAPQATAVSVKKPVTSPQAAQNAPSESQASPSFAAGWTEDFRRTFAQINQDAPLAAPPETAGEPEAAKTPAEIIESLSAGMKQHAAAKVPLPEKKPAREETPVPNKIVAPARPSIAERPLPSLRKETAPAKASPAAKSDAFEKKYLSQQTDAAESSPAPAIRLFQPMLQVDHFAWPKVCGRLEAGADSELERVVETLLAAQIRGKKVFALGGCHYGDGATSLLLATARRLAAQGVKVALVEGDWSQPQLARRLGLLPQYGWEDVLSGRLPLEEVLIESIAERLVILPVREPFTAVELPRGADGRLAESWNSLRRHFDLVLVDPGALTTSSILDPQFAAVMSGRIDAALLVKNLRQHDKTEFDAAAQSLQGIGAKVLGVVENFAG